MRRRALDVMPCVFEDGPWRLQMGLRKLAFDEWLFVTEHYEDEVEAKRRLLAAGAEVIAREPTAGAATDDATAETLALIEAFLTRHHAELMPGTANSDPLVRAGLLVQEDLCWLRPSPEGYRLAAAFVAFPSRWRLADKIGRPLEKIHAPVPNLEARLGKPVARLFERLAADRPVWRANWSIVDDPALHQPDPQARAPSAMLEAGLGEALFLRAERQTLRRLPTSGFVLFTIHSFVEPLARIVAEPTRAEALERRLAELPAAMLAYKGLTHTAPAIRSWLASRRLAA